MSKRLQELLDEPEWPDVQRAARRTEPLAVVRAAAQHAFPTADIDRMLAEIRRGALGQDR